MLTYLPRYRASYPFITFMLWYDNSFPRLLHGKTFSKSKYSRAQFAGTCQLAVYM